MRTIRAGAAVSCLIITLILGCETFDPVTGSTVMLKGSPPARPVSVEDVSIFLEPPGKPFSVLALVSSSVRMYDYSSVAEGEGAALERLKQQAALAGADGVINMTREIMDHGTVVQSTAWTSATAIHHGKRGFPHPVDAWDSSQSSLYRNFSISFRGEAIKFSE